MKELDLIVPNPTGLHARPAKVFVNTAKKFKADIRVQHGAKTVNAKSVISVLTLGVETGGQIRLVVDGPDEDEALATLKEAVESGLGDELSHGAPVADKTNGRPAAPQVGLDGRMLKGIPGAGGIAIGPLYQYRPATVEVASGAAASPAEEQARLQTAIAAARTELTTLHQQVQQRIGAEEAAIFEAHLAILDDPDLFAAASDAINSGQNAGQGWQAAVESTAAALAKVKDELLAARAVDIRDVGQRVLRALTGAAAAGPALPDDPIILIAADLTPSDTVTLDPNRVLGFCTAAGGANGHTAILARALGLPAIVGAGEAVLTLDNSTPAILNGDTGTLTLSPTEPELAQASASQQAQRQRGAAQLAAAQEPAITTDGHRVEVVANIGNLAEARQALQFGAEGVGLLRTEFLFLERDTPPTEDEQFEVYRDIALALAGQPVIIRTLDIGGDKPLPYLTLPAEENPFLGQRGIRLCLARPDLLRTQLRAILRAAAFGPLRIMFPMVTTLEDWRAARQMVTEIRAELNAPAVEVGIMVEVPAAALLAPAFAVEVDFFSIGTNDLTQYTLAMDRTNPAVAGQADGLNPAVLHLIERTVQASHAAGKWTGVCGELAANPQAVPILVGLGVDELSASVPAVPAVKAQVRELALTAAKSVASQALACATAAEVHRVTGTTPP
ncbi:MAG: Phosphoenolpyruvate-protein phosphotransferase [Anaerolineae bacterium]|nr:Phosphoenolpyruvate-protein phosphotransferase [Anaerolineae bacterium]